MPDPDSIDGDVYVFPRYLAGSTFTGDAALAPLLAIGWNLQHDDLGNVYVTAPDRKVRLGYLPEGEDDGLWRITAYTDPFAQPHWGVCFNDMVAPTEFVTAFTTALAQAYTEGPHAYVTGPEGSGPDLSAFNAVVPLINRDLGEQGARLVEQHRPHRRERDTGRRPGKQRGAELGLQLLNDEPLRHRARPSRGIAPWLALALDVAIGQGQRPRSSYRIGVLEAAPACRWRGAPPLFILGGQGDDPCRSCAARSNADSCIHTDSSDPSRRAEVSESRPGTP
ncbi:DUF317 domain-containing protein [Streptomyces sp. NPDC046261]|uniref:DUF317 domain-containing protein n=1 Tax=Streptomyces sp. NPDC046261 TaxID=3157200 RepID=UPI00340D6EAE